MIDETTLPGRMVAAALRLAAERPWADITLSDIAAAAGTTLPEIAPKIASKANVLSELNRMVDQQMLKTMPRAQPGQSARDTLFEVVMARLDAMQPYKAGIRSILKSPTADARLLFELLRTQSLMLEAAGASKDGAIGLLRTAGIASVYGGTLRTWLDDEDPGLAKTMAALDRRLRSGESTLAGAEQVCSALEGACSGLRSLFRGGRRNASQQPTGETGMSGGAGI